MACTMTKSELIDELIRSNPDLPDRAVAAATGVIIDKMADTLVEGNRIEIRGFGSFGLKYRDERIGRNPQDGSPVSVKARYTVFFKAGKSLREEVDKCKDDGN